MSSAAPNAYQTGILIHLIMETINDEEKGQRPWMLRIRDLTKTNSACQTEWRLFINTNLAFFFELSLRGKKLLKPYLVVWKMFGNTFNLIVRFEHFNEESRYYYICVKFPWNTSPSQGFRRCLILFWLVTWVIFVHKTYREISGEIGFLYLIHHENN